MHLARNGACRHVLSVGGAFHPDCTGGGIRNVQLAKALRGLDSEITVITSTPYSDGSFDADFHLETDSYGCRIYRTRRFEQMMAAAIAVVRRTPVDVIHAHNATSALAMMACRLGVPVVLEIHSLQPWKNLKQRLAGMVLRKCAGVIVLAQAAKKYIVAEYQVSDSKIEVVYNGTEHLAAAARQPVDGSVRHVGYVGNMIDWQGVYDLFGAAETLSRTHPQLQFHFVGPGPELDGLRRRVAEGRLEQTIRLYGPMAPSAIPEMLAAWDILAIPRLSTLATETTVPLKVFEYLAAGKPIVAATVGGLMEILVPGEDCETYRPGDSRDLAAAITRLIDDPSLRRRIARRAIENAALQPTWSSSALKLTGLYSAVARS